MNRFLRKNRLPLALWACACLAGGVAFAAEDDEVVEGPLEANPAQQVHFGRIDFDQNVFQPSGNAEQAQQRIETQVKLQLSELNRVCELTDAQVQKLELAARGDVRRFLDEVDAVRRKFAAANNEVNAWNQMWQEIQPLQAKQARGVTGRGSLFMKTLSTTLTREQAAQHGALTDKRRQFRYRASIATALHTIEGTVPLTHEAREALRKVLLAEPAPQSFGQYDFYLVMYRLAQMPPEKIQPLLDDRQWKALQQLFNQYRGMKEFLIQQGLLTREDLGEQFLAAPAGDEKP